MKYVVRRLSAKVAFKLSNEPRREKDNFHKLSFDPMMTEEASAISGLQILGLVRFIISFARIACVCGGLTL